MYKLKAGCKKPGFVFSMSSLRATLTAMTERLQAAGVDSPRLSAEVLLAEALGLDRQDLLKNLVLQPKSPLPEEARQKAATLVERRASGEPVAYITGCKEFYGRPFRVSPATLIPRPETELLLDRALDFLKTQGPGKAPLFADLGTGSGCIAVTLVLESPGLRGLALDTSPPALGMARLNAQELEAQAITFCLADFHHPPIQAESLDLMVANPPYVSEAEYNALSHEVREFEPRSALVPAGAAPGSPGLEDALSIVATAERLLKPGGLLLMEIGSSQGNMCTALSSLAWSRVSLVHDLAGLPRIVEMFKA